MRSWCVLLILAAAFVFAPSLARAEGALVVVGEDGQPRNFPLVRTEVRGDVAGRVVSVWVTQRFRNEFTERIEATYLFPLPDDSADQEEDLGRRQVVQLVDRLQGRQGAIVRAISLEGAGIRDVAAKFGMSEGAVRVALHRGLKSLAQLYRSGDA